MFVIISENFPFQPLKIGDKFLKYFIFESVYDPRIYLPIKKFIYNLITFIYVNCSNSA